MCISFQQVLHTDVGSLFLFMKMTSSLVSLECDWLELMAVVLFNLIKSV